MQFVCLLCNETQSLQPLRKHPAKAIKKTIVFKGKHYKDQWWFRN